MATEKDFRVKSSLVAPTSLQVGSATITSSGTSVVLPANSTIDDGAGGSITIGSPDLTGYATETYVNNAVGAIDLSGYVTTSAIANYLTISSFNTQIAGYTTTTDLNTALAAKANTSSLATVATSGNYNDLSNTPTLSAYATQTYVDNSIAGLTLADIADANTFTNDTFSGDGTTVAFTMSLSVVTSDAIIVAISGVVQDPSTYGVSGTTLTFSEAPPSGTDNISVRFLAVPANAVDSTAYRTVTDITATAGQTMYTVPSYQVGYINVYRNGVRLGDADYTATTGTSVTLAVGADAGDLISVESFRIGSTTTSLTNEAQYVDTQATHVIQYNGQTLSQDVTIGSNANAYSAGPIEISVGNTVTIDDGGVWIIL